MEPDRSRLGATDDILKHALLRKTTLCSHHIFLLPRWRIQNNSGENDNFSPKLDLMPICKV